MIKNKLYPYIEQYINEYLWGFTKEQLEIGILNGTIALENIHLRPDIINNKLNKSEVPFWLKAGRIGKIKVGCSLMNIIGERPLEVEIDDINLVFAPSYKYIFLNRREPVSDTQLKQEYDPIKFNSNSIFDKKINIYDGSVLNTSYNVDYYQDKTKLSRIINKLITLCIEFYTSKPYLVNGTITNIHLRFEDDEMINHSAETIAFSINIHLIKASLSAEGLLKKNTFYIEDMSLYFDNSSTTFIPTELFLKALNGQGYINNDSYYRALCKINFKKLTSSMDKSLIIELKRIKGNVGINSASANSLNIFENKDFNNMTVCINMALDDPLTIHIIPHVITSLSAILSFTKDFKTLKYVNDFKPLYAPLVNNKSITAYFLEHENSYFKAKKKKIIRDWLYYFFWFKQFKKAFEASSYNNERSHCFHNAFRRYMSIVVAHQPKDEMKELSEDIQIIKADHKVKNYCINTNSAAAKEDQESLYPDCFIKSEMSLQLKQIRVYAYSNKLQKAFKSDPHYCLLLIDNNSFDWSISNNQFQCQYSFKHLVIETKETYTTTNKEIPKHEDLLNQIASRQLNTKSQSTNLYSYSSNNASITLNRRLPHSNVNIPKYNTSSSICAGLKVSPLVEETQAIQKSNVKLFQQQARSAKRMKVLCDTLHISKSTAAHVHPIKMINHSQQKQAASSFIASLLQVNESEVSKFQLEKEETQLRTEASISKAIKDYNSKKNKMLNKSVNLGLAINPSLIPGNEDNPKQGMAASGFLNKAVSNNNNLNGYKSIYSIVNNKVKQIKDDYPLSLLNISVSESKEFGCKLLFKKQNSSKTPDVLSLNIGYIRVNVFADYLKELFEIVTSFELGLSQKNQAKWDQTTEMKDKRYLFLMKKYIFDQCLTDLRENPNELLVKYTNYIKDNCLLAVFREEGEITQSEFDLSYFFSNYFSEGIHLDMNYNRIDVLCYNREGGRNDLIARARIPPIHFKLELTFSNIFAQLYDFEYDINDYDCITETINDIIEAFKAKFSKAKKVIEPALKVMKELLIKEKEDESLKKSISINLKASNSSYAYNKAITFTNKAQPVNIKIVNPKEMFYNQNTTFDSTFHHNRACTINNPQQFTDQAKENNTLSMFKSSYRDNIAMLTKNTIS